MRGEDIKLHVGDEFNNSNGNISTIIKVADNGIYCCTNSINNYFVSNYDFIKRFNDGLYTYYITAFKNIKVGDIITWTDKSNFIPSKDLICKIIDKNDNLNNINIEVLEGHYTYNEKLKIDKVRRKSYKSGTISISKINIIKLNNNEKKRKTITDQRRETTVKAIKSVSPRKVAAASRLIGNSISNRVKTTRVGRFEISRKAISI